ncbi:MAG: hypothetical protein V3W34_20555 [Phycisphaerae bacterium]
MDDDVDGADFVLFQLAAGGYVLPWIGATILPLASCFVDDIV